MPPRGQRLGEITDLVMESTAGRVVYVVLAFGDVPLRREKRLALPWQALQQSKGFDTFLPAVDAKELEEAPGFEHDRWPTRAAPQWRRDVAERSWEQATRGAARSMGMRAMPASVWEWPRDRKESCSIAQTLSHWAEAWRFSSSCRAQGLHRHGPLRGLLVPVATIVDLRPTARHGTPPWSPENSRTMRGTVLAA
jgi:hypothetical protein